MIFIALFCAVIAYPIIDGFLYSSVASFLVALGVFFGVFIAGKLVLLEREVRALRKELHDEKRQDPAVDSGEK